jgi:thiaminase/transcriptional activator TenA
MGELMSLAATLWRDNADLAASALEHPFVRGLADGSLPSERFSAFIAQDAFFLDAFARAYALALASCPDRSGVGAFADLLAGVRQELILHATYADQLGFDLTTLSPAPATLAYTDFLLATAAVGGTGPTCAAMTPCMRLYAHIGQCLAEGPTAGTYRQWIDTYADPSFDTLAGTLEGLVDRYVTDIDSARSTYRRAMRLELDFFTAALG